MTSRVRWERQRAARALGRHTREEWERLKMFCGGCVRCKSTDRHLDRAHIVPIRHGGSDAIENLQPLCAWCNAHREGEYIDYRPEGWRRVANA